MAKQQDPRWQLDLRPVTPGRGPADSADGARPMAGDIVQLLVDLQHSVDGLRDAIDKIGRRLVVVERAIRERDGEVGEVGVRPLRDAKPVRPIPPLRLEPRRRAGRPRAVNEGDRPGD